MREQVGVHADHMVPLWHSGPERMTVALGAVALVPFGSGSNCACFLRTGGLDGAPELRLDGPRLAGAVITRDADDDVYYYIRWRLKLEGETENMRWRAKVSHPTLSLHPTLLAAKVKNEV